MSEVTVEVPGDALPVENQAQQVEELVEDATASEIEEFEEAQGEEHPKKIGGVTKRINELTANWRQEQRRSNELQAMLDRVLPKGNEPKAEPQAQPQSEPQLDSFRTYEEYVAAVADFRAEKKVEELLERQSRQEAERQKATRHDAFIAKAESFEATTPDFKEIAFNPRLPITDVMANVLDLSEQGPQILYFLGKNPEEAARIARLPDYQSALELGRLEARLSMPQPKTMSSAPPPIRPLSGGSGSAIVDPDKMTTNEWRQWREEQLRKR